MPERAKMLNRKQLIEAYFKGCKKINLPPERVVVGAGGVCVLLGIRESTNDIDVDVVESDFNKLLKVGYKSHQIADDYVVLEVTEHMDVHGVDEIVDTVVIEGVTCYSVKSVLDFKLKLNREKDKADIEALKKLLNQLIQAPN